MSKIKKTWLPVIIVLVLAAMILLLALIGSKFKDEKGETLSDTPAPTETVSVEQAIKEMMEAEKEKTPAPEQTKTPQKSSTGSSSKSDSSSQTPAPKETEAGSEIYQQWSAVGQRIQEGLQDAAEGISGTIREIGKPFTPDSDGGAILTPKEVTDGVRGVIDGFTNGIRQGLQERNENK